MASGNGWLNVSRSVDGSTASTFDMFGSNAAPFEPVATAALMFATALSALNGVPSWKVTSLRSGSVSWVLSAFHFHDVASIGSRPWVSAVTWINRSYDAV